MQFLERIRDRVARSTIMYIWKKADDKMSVEHPVGWEKTKKLLSGWKTVVGYLVYETPDILRWAEATLPSLLPAVGVENAEPVLRGIGSVLMVVGLLHKLIRFVEPVDADVQELEAEKRARKLRDLQ
jgi:hypothetical protein